MMACGVDGSGSAENMKVVVLVKAAPVLTRELEETMCVAGVRVDDGHNDWVRLHPVPFRDLNDKTKFVKYQTVAVRARRPRSDRRPESWSPLQGSIYPAESIGTGQAWARRRQIVEGLGGARMCDLVEANRSGSGSQTPSLAVVRPVEPPILQITHRDDEQLRVWRQRATAAASRLSLFDEPGTHKPELEVVPWRFRYSFHCSAPTCKGHSQTIVDWEVAALWRHVRHRDDWMAAMRVKLEQDLWQGRATVLFAGNQQQHPISFLVLGVFWPPDAPTQGVLDF